MKQFKTVFKFEYFNYIKSKGYLAVTITVLAIVVILTSLPALMGVVSGITDSFSGGTGAETTGDGEAQDNIKKAMILDPENAYSDETLAEYFPDYVWDRVSDMSTAEQDIMDEVYDLALSVDGTEFTVYERSGDMFTESAGAAAERMVTRAAQTAYLEENGLSSDQAGEALNLTVTGETVTIGKDYQQNFFLSYAIVFIMYMIIIIYGQFITVSVVTEKSTKAMELLITSAKPFQLMMGKVLGVGAAGLTQFGLLIVTTLASFKLNEAGWIEFQPMVAAILGSTVSGGLVIYAIVFLLLGFFSFAFIYAGFASTVSRMEEANSVMMLPMLMFMAAFFVAMFGSYTPEATFVKVCSFVPFLSPLVMFMRICVTETPMYEALIAIAINIATVLGAGFISSRIYKVGVMLYGKKPNLKDIINYIAKA